MCIRDRVYTEEGNRNPVKIAENGIKYARQKNYNVVIVDTAGRLAVDAAMTITLAKIHRSFLLAINRRSSMTMMIVVVMLSLSLIHI